MTGRTIYDDKVLVEKGNINKTLNLGTNIANGTYLIRIKNADINKAIRFTVDK